MAKQKNVKQSFLHGAAILVGAMVFVKLVGALFKIPLANILGEVGSGYFNTAYSIFTPIYTLSIAGLPAAVSKIVAEKAARGEYRDIRKLLRIARVMFFTLGIAGSILMLILAQPLANMLKNPNSYYSVLAIAPAIFFGCMIASYRGYYEGLQNMTPTAISQIVEVFIKLVLGLGFSAFLLEYGMNQYEETGIVFGQAVKTLSQAKLAVLPFASAGAILGVSISTLGGTIFLFFRHRIIGDGISKESLAQAPTPAPSKKILSTLIKIAIPISIASLVINITSLIDVMTIMRRLSVAIETGKDIILEQYGAYIPQGMTDLELPNFIYGAYSGFAISIFSLVPSLTSVFGKSALPNVASAWAANNMNEVKRNIESVIRVTGLIAIPAGLGLFAMSHPILKLLFPNQEGAVFIATPVLRYMGIGVIFLSLAMPIFSILQALGRSDIPVKLMIVGGTLKMLSNYVLVAIPSINIKGAPFGTIICYGVIVVASLVCLCRLTKIKIDVKSVMIKPLISSILCAGGAFGSYHFFGQWSDSNGITIVSIMIGILFYAISLLAIRGISKDDILMLPNGEKIVKTLEKKRLIG